MRYHFQPSEIWEMDFEEMLFWFEGLSFLVDMEKQVGEQAAALQALEENGRGVV